MVSILDSIRNVVELAEHVKINREKVIEFSESSNSDSAVHWLECSPFSFSKFSGEHKLRFVLIFNALSFSYWGEPKWTVEYGGKVHDGAWGMILALGRAVEENINLLDFKYCSGISLDEFRHIIRANVEIPLLEDRWKILREIGSIMRADFNGETANLILKANKDAMELLSLIIESFPSFSDRALYKGHNVYFYKRAQLLTADIFQIFEGKGYGELENMEQITACADYKLPQILRRLGILSYSEELEYKVDNMIEIQEKSPEEVEIRASTIWAVELISRELKARGRNILPFQVNDGLWLATQDKSAFDKPYHRTRTTAY